MAKVPTTRLRSTGRFTGTPLNRALVNPVTASASNTAAMVTGSRTGTGANTTPSNGISAPSTNATIEAEAACQGLVRWSADTPADCSVSR